MEHLKFLCKVLNCLIEEVGSLITHQDSGAFEPCNNIFKNELR